MDLCKGKEIKVINKTLIEKCLDKQRPKGEAGRLALTEGIPLDEVEQIRLEFSNILKIDHIWVLTSLRKLSLNNNLIEKIENLDTLIHLIELDLSLNKISIIENLDKLCNLEKLNLFDNQIIKIDNLDHLNNKLTMFCIGKNKIEDSLHNVIYLRRLTNLKSLNMAGNPCADDNSDFRIFIAGFLPQLIYYEYKFVDDTEKQLGIDKFSKELRTLENDELTNRLISQAKEQELHDADSHSESFVEYLNSRHLFDSLFEIDVEGRAMLDMDDGSDSEEVNEFYIEYEDAFINICKEIFFIGQQQFVNRQEEINQFTKCVDDAKRDNQKESIEQMEIFLEEKAKVFATIKCITDELLSSHRHNRNTAHTTVKVVAEYNDTDENDELIDEQSLIYQNAIHKIWKNLTERELQLYEQMEEIIQYFGHSLTEQVDTFIEASQALFSQMRALEVGYMENISECAGRYFTNSNITENFVIAESLKMIMSEKDALYNALGASHNLHMQLIDNREDMLVSRARQWLENVLNNLEKDEIRRNRGKILEINHFLDIQREDLDDLISDMMMDSNTIDTEIAIGF